MKLKALVLTVAVLAVLSAVAFWANRAQSPAAADPRIGEPLGDPTAIEKAAIVRLSDQGRTIVLTRAPDGSWLDTSYFGLPADFSKLAGFAGDLVTARIQRLVTVNPDRMARLEFKDTRIEFLDAAGRALWSATLGRSADSGGRFIRFDGEDRAYLANLNASLDTEPRDWASAQLLDLKSDDVASVEVGFDQGAPVTVMRTAKDGPWTAAPASAGHKVSADTVSSLLASLGALRFSDTSDLADPQVAAAKRHLRTVRITSFQGRTTVISMGRKPEEKMLKSGSRKAESGNARPDTMAAPEYETIPAGPVYVFITSSDKGAPINGLMQKRAFQVDEYTFTSLPQKPADLFEPAK